MGMPPSNPKTLSRSSLTGPNLESHHAHLQRNTTSLMKVQQHIPEENKNYAAEKQ